jgi:hypothetical protein
MTNRAFENDVLASLSAEDLIRATGGQMAPSTLLNLGVNAMSLMDHPQKTLDTIKGFLGMPDSGGPRSVYTPATMNPDGGITRGRLDAPRDPNLPQVPISQ